jgi:hypothetical protein
MEPFRSNFFDLTNVAGVWVTASASGSAIRLPVYYECRVFGLVGRACDTSLDEDIWAGDKKAWERIRKSVRLCAESTFRLGSDRLAPNRRGGHWNGKKLSSEEGRRETLPEDGNKMTCPANPLMKTGELIATSIESRQPFPYFAKRENGLFERKEMRLSVGMVVVDRAGDPGGHAMLVSDLTLFCDG